MKPVDTEALLKHIGDKLSFERFKSGNTRKTMVAQLGINKMALFYYEKGMKSIRIDELVALCHFYDVPIQDFIGEFNVQEKKKDF